MESNKKNEDSSSIDQSRESSWNSSTAATRTVSRRRFELDFSILSLALHFTSLAPYPLKLEL